MVNSINTNAGSLLGVQSLQKTKSLLGKSESELSTGKTVSGARDNAAIFSIAQILKGNVAGLNSVKDSLNRAISSADVALSGAGQVSDLLVSLKEKAVQAADPGLDDASRLALNDEFTALRDQVSSIVGNAEFNGKNALKAGGDDIIAIADDSADGTITIAAQDLSLGGGNVTLGPAQSIATLADAQATVTAIDDSIANVSAAVSELGSGSARLQETRDFAEVLSGATEVGIGNLVDANLAKTNANYVANQVREQLGIKALSIANRQPAAILSLFRT